VTGGHGGALPALVAVAVGTGYLVLAGGCGRGGGRRWSRWRGAAFLGGLCVLVVALGLPGHGFRAHMARHLLLGMVAPVGLVLGAPVTLLLRTLPRDRARALTRVLHGPPLRVLAHPVTALLLNPGGLVALYLTPLYAATTTRPWLNAAVHAHVLASGYLFAWVIAGPDPAPRRPGVPTRLFVLGAAVAAHATVAQLIYAGAPAVLPVDEADRRAAGDLMYYGGDLAELLLAMALLTTWRPRQHRAHDAGDLAVVVGVRRGKTGHAGRHNCKIDESRAARA
jgi:putative membrane protein